MQYTDFLHRKRPTVVPGGLSISPADLSPQLFPYQRDVVAWALRLGKAALFEERGLGKTIQQLEWARVAQQHTQGRVLIACPLAVAHQTIAEARTHLDLGVTYVRTQAEVDVAETPIVITNYDRLLNRHFTPEAFAGIVLDESSILKHYTSATRNYLTQAFAQTPYRLACTATPSPNDIVELGNHSEFLGVMSAGDMLTKFFIRDSNRASTFRLRGHAVKDYWAWVTEWAVCLSRPSDLNPAYSDTGYDLPQLQLLPHRVSVDHTRAWQPDRNGQLPMFLDGAASATAMWGEKRATIADRAAKVADIVAKIPDNEPIIIWHLTDAERDVLKAAVPEAVIVTGSQAPEVKERLLSDFTSGRARIISTKPSIAGFGLNWQHCNQMIFASIDHKFEVFYQALGRCHRYGQTRPVHAHVVYAESEETVLGNLQRKWSQHLAMQQEVIAAMRTSGLAARAWRRDTPDGTRPVVVPEWVRSN
ncbi:MAG: DEAD/DEAH box helicase [Kouleothrix sp.]|jgi:superfamily II DNA or RNA helicase|nr:DEAD/DEAH box helicase [Kouleothrix sp.]